MSWRDAEVLERKKCTTLNFNFKCKIHANKIRGNQHNSKTKMEVRHAWHGVLRHIVWFATLKHTGCSVSEQSLTAGICTALRSNSKGKCTQPLQTLRPGCSSLISPDLQHPCSVVKDSGAFSHNHPLKHHTEICPSSCRWGQQVPTPLALEARPWPWDLLTVRG